MLRNREFSRALIAWVAVALASSCAAALLSGMRAAFCCAVAVLLAGLPFVVLTCQRYRAIAALSAAIDDVLHGERSIDFTAMSEGELAILVNELGKMVARMRVTADDLQREKQTLADALADISHQIKTPMTSLSITTELVRKNLAARGDCASEVERLKRIERLQVHVEDLVGVLLRLARLDAGALSLAREPVDVERLVVEAAQPLAIAFEIAQVELVVCVEGNCSFTGDRAWTAEALGNILKNCLEHTPAGGTVTVTAREDALACRISIVDTGTGIAEEDMPHVFERFYRGKRNVAPSKVNPAGVGIGLSLAQALIHAQDGAVSASNERDASGAITGARFDIAFFKAIV